MWAVIEELAGTGTTVFLTTQYLEEADRLARKIAVIEDGHVIASGTPAELKARIGGERFDLTLAPGSDLEAALAALLPYRSPGEVQVNAGERRLSVPVSDGARRLAAITRDLDDARVVLVDVALRRPTLDDVFLTLTGHATGPSPKVAVEQERQPAARRSE
jgi:ABC-2 type transport system ATP-binding protein